MGKPKLFILLGGLDAAELSAFGRYLNRNHGRNDIALRTFSFLKKYHPDFADKKVEDLDHLARKVFCPKGPVDQKCRKNLSNTFHDLYNWLKDFLLLEKAKDGSMGSDYLWVSLLRGRRSLLVPYQQAASRLLARVREAPEKDALGHMRRLAACYLQYYEGMGMQKISEKREALIGCSRELEEFYKTWRRKIDCELINWNSQFLRDADNRILEEELQAPEPTLLNRLYGQVYSLLSAEGGDPEFQSLKKMLSEQAVHLARTEAYTVYVYLKNFCSKQVRRGQNAYWQEAHGLDLLAIKHQWFAGRQGLMSDMQFFNVLNAACKVQAVGWAKAFIKDYSPLVDYGFEEERVQLANSMVQFGEGKYEELVQVLMEWPFRNPLYSIRSRALVLLARYELDSDDIDLYQEALNFEQFLLRQKSTLGRKYVKDTSGFLRIFKMLIDEKKSADQIKTAIEEASPLYFADWLLEKLATYPSGR